MTEIIWFSKSAKARAKVYFFIATAPLLHLIGVLHKVEHVHEEHHLDVVVGEGEEHQLIAGRPAVFRPVEVIQTERLPGVLLADVHAARLDDVPPQETSKFPAKAFRWQQIIAQVVDHSAGWQQVGGVRRAEDVFIISFSANSIGEGNGFSAVRQKAFQISIDHGDSLRAALETGSGDHVVLVVGHLQVCEGVCGQVDDGGGNQGEQGSKVFGNSGPEGPVVGVDEVTSTVGDRRLADVHVRTGVHQGDHQEEDGDAEEDEDFGRCGGHLL